MRQVKIYDTTLRDGTQAEDFNLSLADKIRIAEKLDHLGIHYIEGGWPGSNPKDMAFFKAAKKLKLKSSVVVAFGSTRRANTRVNRDVNVRGLLEAGTKIITVF